MSKLVLLGFVGALIVAACASTEGTDMTTSTVLPTSTTETAEGMPPSQDPTVSSTTPNETTIPGANQSAEEDTTVTTTSGDAGDLVSIGEDHKAEGLPSSTTTTPTVAPRGLEPLVATAVEDLSGRFAVEPADVTVVSVESVVWPDGSLGCPQPGMAYTQVQVDGTRIVLSLNGTLYEYHSGGNRAPFLCTKS